MNEADFWSFYHLKNYFYLFLFLLNQPQMAFPTIPRCSFASDMPQPQRFVFIF